MTSCTQAEHDLIKLDPERWATLHIIGYAESGAPGQVLECRNCAACGGTLARAVDLGDGWKSSHNPSPRRATVVYDTGWRLAPTANPRRGLYDYERQIVFGVGVTDGDALAEIARIQKEENPGYCGWSANATWGTRPLGSSKWRLTSTWDSSG